MSETRSTTLVKEQPHQMKAFEFYYGLNEHRSYEKVAREFNVAPSTVKLWGKSFGWKARVRDRDLDVARDVATRTLDGEISRRERNTQIVQMAILQLARAVAEGQIKLTLADLDRLIRLEAYLSDEPESRHEIVVSDLANKSDDELRSLVKEEMRMLEALEVEPGGVPPHRPRLHDAA